MEYWNIYQYENIIASFPVLRIVRDGPLENLWGGGGRAGEVQKNYSRKGKLNEKKIMHAN